MQNLIVFGGKKDEIDLSISEKNMTAFVSAKSLFNVDNFLVNALVSDSMID